MKLLTLADLARAMAWPVLATQFNRYMPGFPKPASQDDNGENLFDLDAVRKWDHNRPIEGADSFS